jgi:hypothetical protein
MRQTSSPNGPETSVWFERVYASETSVDLRLHRTVHGPRVKNRRHDVRVETIAVGYLGGRMSASLVATSVTGFRRGTL